MKLLPDVNLHKNLIGKGLGTSKAILHRHLANLRSLLTDDVVERRGGYHPSKIPVAMWFRARAHARAFRAWSDGISGYAF